MEVSALALLLVPGIAAHVSVITAYHYVVNSPIVAVFAVVFTFLDIYLLFLRQRRAINH